MQANSPHFLLFSEASSQADHRCHWRFVLRSVAGDESLAATDIEPGVDSGRLELLAVVRGLEALDQPSRVTLLTKSRYVSRGIRRGISQWRERRWHWERFGQLVPIRNQDLWRRVDRALRIHQVECYPWQSDQPPHAPAMADRHGTPDPEPVGETALLIVPRRPRPSSPYAPLRQSTFGRALARLGHAAAASLASICRPAFTRAT